MALLAAMIFSASTKASAQLWPAAAGVSLPFEAGPRRNWRSKALAMADRSASRVTGLGTYWIGPCGGCFAWLIRPGSARRTIPSNGWIVAARRTNSSPRPKASRLATRTCTRCFSNSAKPSSSVRKRYSDPILVLARGGKLPDRGVVVDDKDV